MKILNVELNPYPSFNDLVDAFWNAPTTTGAQLLRTQEEAEQTLIESQRKYPHSIPRVFWWQKRGTEYIMSECLFD